MWKEPASGGIKVGVWVWEHFLGRWVTGRQVPATCRARGLCVQCFIPWTPSFQQRAQSPPHHCVCHGGRWVPGFVGSCPGRGTECRSQLGHFKELGGGQEGAEFGGCRAQLTRAAHGALWLPVCWLWPGPATPLPHTRLTVHCTRLCAGSRDMDTMCRGLPGEVGSLHGRGQAVPWGLHPWLVADI